MKEKDEAKRADAALDLLAAESASLVLARCMMLRFFEDHNFFGQKKHLCNGGVKAFQQMREHFGTSYVRLLRETYGEGSRIYPAVFSEHELDWVLNSRDPQLSNAIERALFYLSHFDFATIEQDVLSNIYGQFLDTSQRKKLGEHYTPPDIARYIVRQLDLKTGDKVLDPSCGLGTFLIEAYKALAGNAAAKGVATYDDVPGGLAQRPRQRPQRLLRDGGPNPVALAPLWVPRRHPAARLSRNRDHRRPQLTAASARARRTLRRAHYRVLRD